MKIIYVASSADKGNSQVLIRGDISMDCQDSLDNLLVAVVYVRVENDYQLIKVDALSRYTPVDVKDILDIMDFCDVGLTKNKVIIRKQEMRCGLICPANLDAMNILILLYLG